MKLIFCSVFIALMVSQINAQFGGSVASNPSGGVDGSIHYGRAFGTPNHNVGGAVFGQGSSLGGRPTYGGALNYNKWVSINALLSLFVWK